LGVEHPHTTQRSPGAPQHAGKSAISTAHRPHALDMTRGLGVGVQHSRAHAEKGGPRLAGGTHAPSPALPTRNGPRRPPKAKRERCAVQTACSEAYGRICVVGDAQAGNQQSVPAQFGVFRALAHSKRCPLGAGRARLRCARPPFTPTHSHGYTPAPARPDGRRGSPRAAPPPHPQVGSKGRSTQHSRKGTLYRDCSRLEGSQSNQARSTPRVWSCTAG
jgi:hypothetical protein